MLASETVYKLYRTYAEAVETRRIDDFISKTHGKTIKQLDDIYNREMKQTIAAGGDVETCTQLESYKLFMFAWLLDQVWNAWEDHTLMVFQKWNDEHPDYTILARRRMKEIEERKAKAALEKLGPLENTTRAELESYFFSYAHNDIAVQAVPRVRDKTRSDISVSELSPSRHW